MRFHIPTGRSVLSFASAASLVCGIAASGVAHAQPTNVPALLTAQDRANSKPGPRTVPARVIPVPDDLDADAAALVRAPYCLTAGTRYEGLSHAQFLFDPKQTVAKHVYHQITRFFDAHLQK